MKDSTINLIGRLTFGLTFLFGNIFFFGFFITDFIEFAIFGSYFILLALILNTTVLFILLMYASLNTSQFMTCVKSVLIILLNVPISFFYGFLIYN